MKHFRLAGMAIALTLGTASVTLAQQPVQQQQETHQREGRFQRGGRGGFKELFKDIKLTDAQKQQLKQLREKDRAQFQAQKGSGEVRRERPDTTQMRQRREQRFAELRSILTPDQQKQFDKNVIELQQKMAERRKEHQKRA